MASKNTATKTAKTSKASKTPATEVATAPKTAKTTNAQSTKMTISVAELNASDDKKMHGIRVHGKEFVGKVISDKANKTVTVEWERRRLIPKFERYEKRYSRVYAHNPPALSAKMGDTVRIVETRPLSKTKNFVVVEIITKAGTLQ